MKYDSKSPCPELFSSPQTHSFLHPASSEQAVFTTTFLASTSPMANERPRALLPVLELEFHEIGQDLRTRRGTIEAKEIQDSLRQMDARELRGNRDSDQKTLLSRSIRHHADTAYFLEQDLQQKFIPLHTPNQFLGPRIFFVSSLFSVRSTKEARKLHIEMKLPVPDGADAIQYVGPELRQSDALVFLALLHMLRDFRTGISVSFQPEDVCRSLFGRYDGNARRQLREHIQRLQQGLLIFRTFSVQLCQTFEYPKTGAWSVALDRHIVEIFSLSKHVWFPLHERTALPEGLASWLYTFISSQTRLIPMRLSTLRELCGSKANDKAFSNRMRDALKLLTRLGTIDPGWSLKHGEVRWRKPSKD